MSSSEARTHGASLVVPRSGWTTEDFTTFEALELPGADATSAAREGARWLVTTSEGALYVSEDEGLTWTVDLEPTGEPLVHVDATDGAEVIAVCGGDSQMRFRESVE